PQGPRPAQGRGRSGNGGGNSYGSGFGGGQPGHGRHDGHSGPTQRSSHAAQPDPLRTSVDSMAERGRRGGGNRNAGGYGAGGGSSGFGGRGQGPRGPGSSRGSFGR
ncbi:MAG: DEAD/DEAH box helicase, partial [Burkholderiaceae bacterium]